MRWWASTTNHSVPPPAVKDLDRTILIHGQIEKVPKFSTIILTIKIARSKSFTAGGGHAMIRCRGPPTHVNPTYEVIKMIVLIGVNGR